MSPERRFQRERCSPSGPALFSATQWSLVLAVGNKDDSGSHALEELCRIYWLPLYSYVRRQGYAPHDAQDFTQGFFLRLLRMNSLSQINPEKGKFRTFLLASLNHYLSDQRDIAGAAKRGGGVAITSLEEVDAEQRYLELSWPALPPEMVFDRRWAITVLEQALHRLREEYTASDRRILFDRLRGFLSAETTELSHREVAQDLGMTRGGLAVAVHRLRQRYRECIRLELARTVSNPADLDDEMHYLFSTITG